MAEKLSSVQPLESRLKIPAIEGFDQIVDVAKNSNLLGFPADNLDEIYTFWAQDLPVLVKSNLRMDKAVQLENLPQAETNSARQYHDDFLTVTEEITGNMQRFFAKPADRTWKADVKPIIQAIHEYQNRDDIGFYEDSITVLLEAINETKGNWKDETDIKQRIAQHALEELWSTCSYEQLHFAADTDVETSTLDDIDEEKSEFIAALRGEKWTEAETKAYKKQVRALKNALAEIDYGTYSDYLDLLWKNANGTGAKKTTAIDILITAEELFQDIKNEGALEWDPEEEFEEE